MEITQTTLKIGLPKPVRVLHVTDTHVALTDDRDDERCRRTIERCQRVNNDPDGAVKIQHLRDAVEYANAHCDLLVHSGDFLCNVAILSIEKTREALEASKNWLLVAGNHEFTRYGFDAWEDETYKLGAYPTLERIIGRDLLFTSRVVGGVNFVGIDDSYNQFQDWQLWRLKREAQKGLPMVLFMHVPLFEQSLYEKTMAINKNDCCYLVGCDEEHLMPMSEFRAVQHRPTQATLRMINYINSEPLIKALLTGHVHFDYESRLPGGAVQYVTHQNFDDRARELTLI